MLNPDVDILELRCEGGRLLVKDMDTGSVTITVKVMASVHLAVWKMLTCSESAGFISMLSASF